MRLILFVNIVCLGDMYNASLFSCIYLYLFIFSFSLIVVINVCKTHSVCSLPARYNTVTLNKV